MNPKRGRKKKRAQLFGPDSRLEPTAHSEDLGTAATSDDENTTIELRFLPPTPPNTPTRPMDGADAPPVHAPILPPSLPPAPPALDASLNKDYSPDGAATRPETQGWRRWFIASREFWGALAIAYDTVG